MDQGSGFGRPGTANAGPSPQGETTMGNNDQRDQQSGKTGNPSTTNQGAASPQGSTDRKDTQSGSQQTGNQGGNQPSKDAPGNAPAGDRKDAAPKGDAPTKA